MPNIDQDPLGVSRPQWVSLQAYTYKKWCVEKVAVILSVWHFSELVSKDFLRNWRQMKDLIEERST